MWPFKKRTLKDAVSETKKVVIEGVVFKIRRINPMSYMQGYDVVLQEISTYQVGKVASPENIDKSLKKTRKHWEQIILAGVVEPNIVRKDDGMHTTIDEILNNFELASKLYEAILYYAYGKKKARAFGLTRND